jgi:hypothetical protein
MQVIVDVREAVPRDRQALALRAFDRLPVGGTLTLIDDEDPGALFLRQRRRTTASSHGSMSSEGRTPGACASASLAAARPGLADEPGAQIARPAPVSS